jgi:hypothetical protein
LIQIKQSDEARLHAFLMTAIDWLELIGIATLLITVGTLCAVFFAI